MTLLDGVLQAQAINNAWANRRLYEACGRLSREEYEREGASFFPSIRLTLEHILEVDRFYIDALEGGGGGRRVRSAEGLSTPQLLGEAQRLCDLRLIAFCRALTSADLESRVVEMERETHVQRDRVLPVLQHLFQHQIHHRGQAHALLSGTSVAPPQLDDFFLSDDIEARAEALPGLGLSEADIWGA